MCGVVLPQPARPPPAARTSLTSDVRHVVFIHAAGDVRVAITYMYSVQVLRSYRDTPSAVVPLSGAIHHITWPRTSRMEAQSAIEAARTTQGLSYTRRMPEDHTAQR